MRMKRMVYRAARYGVRRGRRSYGNKRRNVVNGNSGCLSVIIVMVLLFGFMNFLMSVNH